MTYRCLGNDRYEFTLKVYRDCNCSQCAEIDPEANIGIYRCPGGDCGNQNQFSAYGSLSVPLESIRDVATPNYPCLIEPDVCVEEGIYIFEVTLPRSDELTYHISYQRCCRNVTINNIFRPEEQGATYTIAITPEAQAVCNSSPVFNTFPPIVICGNSPLIYDHSAFDPDGDQLVYEFCAPRQGGGPITQPRETLLSCAGAYPSPACPPPYPEVVFVPPLYTAENPMGGSPRVGIDPNTGIITGTPTVQGQFVVGVCVSEYRNGVLLSRMYRDFQFNVENCDPEVVADLQKDIEIADQVYQVNSCGSTDVKFINESYQERFIDEFIWTFNIEGEERTFREWDPTVTFPGVGEYEGSLVLNPGTDCGDTALIFVDIYPDLEADFEYEYDTCVAGEVIFTDRSTAASGYLTDWAWEFGDGNASREQDPAHLYRDPGNIPVKLTVTDTNRCVESTTKIINYFPVPALLVVSPSAFDGCEPVDIFFDNLSFPVDSTYDIRWNFGDGGSSGAISPTYTYEREGIFTVDLTITSPIGCVTDTIFPDLIKVLPSPDAGYSFSPDDPSVINPEVSFFDESSFAGGYFWDFQDGSTSSLPNPVHTFRDTGRYEVMQVVTHPNGCRDTLTRLVDIRPEVRYHLPNAFTPNNDGKNDEYLGVGLMVGATNFNLSIWNRWGQQIFQTTDPNEGWNGRIYNTGQEAPGGVYVVRVSFRGPRGEQFSYKSFATLIR